MINTIKNWSLHSSVFDETFEKLNRHGKNSSACSKRQSEKFMTIQRKKEREHKTFLRSQLTD